MADCRWIAVAALLFATGSFVKESGAVLSRLVGHLKPGGRVVTIHGHRESAFELRGGYYAAYAIKV